MAQRSIGVREVLDALEASRPKIVEVYQERLQRQVQSYRGLPAEHLKNTATLLITRFINLLAHPLDSSTVQTHVSLLSELLGDLELVSRARAGSGIGSGDMMAAILILLSAAREQVLDSFPDGEMRAANQVWTQFELTAASAMAWMLDEHRRHLSSTT
jgi:hypothetical protein